jgi:hypothetical protein
LNGKGAAEEIELDFDNAGLRHVAGDAAEGAGAVGVASPQSDRDLFACLDVSVGDDVTSMVRCALVPSFLIFEQTDFTRFRFVRHSSILVSFDIERLNRGKGSLSAMHAVLWPSRAAIRTASKSVGEILMRKTLLAAALIAVSAMPASASSDAAWSALFAKANGTCIGQSKMVSPEASAPVVFDDATGKIAILIREAVVRGKKKTMTEVVCLYDKKSGRASIAEYHWLGK